MDPPSVTAVTPCRFLDLPREVRDDIYEAAIFDFSPSDIFMKPQDPDSLRFRKMDINVLLANRQVYWEARDVIVRRAQLILVSINSSSRSPFQARLRDAFCGIDRIDPMYYSLCIMSHHIDGPIPPGRETHPAIETQEFYEFILHRHDTEFFCRIMMGDFDCHMGMNFSSIATHTIDLHPAPTYGQHEFNSVYAAQTVVLQKYRQTFRNFEHFYIVGPSIGWETGLYGAVLQDIRSIDDRGPIDLIDDIRALEQKGSQILLQTGDFEAADVLWCKALGKCVIACLSFEDSSRPDLWDDHVPDASRPHVRRWIRLRRQHGDECAFPFLELWYKLVRNRFSRALHFVEQGHHLATRHGHSPRPTYDYLYFVAIGCDLLREISEFLEVNSWSPQPADEAQLCLTVAAIIRILNITDGVQEAYRAVLRASELAPDDEPIQQERSRVEAWIRILVDDGTLEHFPSSESLTEPWWSTFDIDLDPDL